MIGRPKRLPDADGFIECKTCKRTLHMSEFGPAKNTASKLEHRCRRCNIRRRQKWVNENVEVALEILADTHRRNLAAGSRRRVEMLADTCISKRVLIDMWTAQQGRCAVTGVAMTHIQGRGRVPTNVSIDRVDSSVGYLRENVRLVCLQVNIMRAQLDDEQLAFWCGLILDNVVNTPNVRN